MTSVQRLFALVLAVLLIAHVAACSSTKDLVSPDGSLVAKLETKSSPPNTYWNVTVKVRTARDANVLACFNDDAGVEYDPQLSWTGQRELLIETTVGTITATIDGNGQALNIEDPDEISLC